VLRVTDFAADGSMRVCSSFRARECREESKVLRCRSARSLVQRGEGVCHVGALGNVREPQEAPRKAAGASFRFSGCQLPRRPSRSPIGSLDCLRVSCFSPGGGKNGGQANGGRSGRLSEARTNEKRAAEDEQRTRPSVRAGLAAAGRCPASDCAGVDVGAGPGQDFSREGRRSRWRAVTGFGLVFGVEKR
jgi:hypothetical protein